MEHSQLVLDWWDQLDRDPDCILTPHMACGKHANRRPKGEAVLSWDWEHSIRWYMTRIISRRFGFPIILGGVSGNAASISALLVWETVGAILLGYPFKCRLLTLYLLVGYFLNTSQNS